MSEMRTSLDFGTLPLVPLLYLFDKPNIRNLNIFLYFLPLARLFYIKNYDPKLPKLSRLVEFVQILNAEVACWIT